MKGKGIGFLIAIIFLQLLIIFMAIVSLFPFASIVLFIPIIVVAILSIIFAAVLFVK